MVCPRTKFRFITNIECCMSFERARNGGFSRDIDRFPKFGGERKFLEKSYFSSWTDHTPHFRPRPNFNFSAPFDLEIAATLLIHPLLVGVAGISRAKGACLQGEVWRSYLRPFLLPSRELGFDKIAFGKSRLRFIQYMYHCR